jgi:hypothetical protein
MNPGSSEATVPAALPRRSGMDEPMHPVQIAGFRKMSVAQKFATIIAMREMGIKLRIVGLRLRHSDWSPEKLETEARKAAMYASTG